MATSWRKNILLVNCCSECASRRFEYVLEACHKYLCQLRVLPLHLRSHSVTCRHALECGYKAVMVTVDSPVLSIREQTYGNPQWVAALASLPGGGFPPIRGFEEIDPLFGKGKKSKCSRLTWADVAWMVGCTSLKVPRLHLPTPLLTSQPHPYPSISPPHTRTQRPRPTTPPLVC